MQRETHTAFNQPGETLTAFEVAPAWKLTLSQEVPVYGNAFFADSLAALNRQAPLGYKLLNPPPEPLPDSALLHAFKADGIAWPPLREVLNTEELPALAVAWPYLHKIGV